jgi:hypothetical protein
MKADGNPAVRFLFSGCLMNIGVDRPFYTTIAILF